MSLSHTPERCNYCLHGLLIAVNLVALLMANFNSFFCIIVSAGGCKNQHKINFQEFSVALTFTFCNQSLTLWRCLDIEEEFVKISAAISEKFDSEFQTKFFPQININLWQKRSRFTLPTNAIVNWREIYEFLRCN
jgi:hypothetical protein